MRPFSHSGTEFVTLERKVYTSLRALKVFQNGLYPGSALAMRELPISLRGAILYLYSCRPPIPIYSSSMASHAPTNILVQLAQEHYGMSEALGDV